MHGAPGRQIGPWHLLELLGEGGMGEVWSAEGPAGRIALKLVTRSSRDPVVLQRFEREAQSLARLAHPNVVRFLDFGRSGEIFFLALELLQGETLEERLQRKRVLAPGEVARIGHAAADGLAAAHELGVIHRDVKPANLFVCADGTVKVLDFGLSLVFVEDETGSRAMRMTRPGMVLGTPSYMAPEQVSGHGEPDARTDVWALGAVLFRALTGHPPFAAGGHSLAEMVRIATEQPDPLPLSVPSRLADVVEQALRKPMAERFPDMRAMGTLLAELASLLAADAAWQDTVPLKVGDVAEAIARTRRTTDVDGEDVQDAVRERRTTDVDDEEVEDTFSEGDADQAVAALAQLAPEADIDALSETGSLGGAGADLEFASEPAIPAAQTLKMSRPPVAPKSTDSLDAATRIDIDPQQALGSPSSPEAEAPMGTGVSELHREARLVSVVLADGISDEAALGRFLAAVEAFGGMAAPLRGGQGVGVFGGAQWLGDEPRRAVQAAFQARTAVNALSIGTGKAVVGSRQAGAVTGQALDAALGALERWQIDRRLDESGSGVRAGAEVGAGSVVACAETRRSASDAFVFDEVRVLGRRPGGAVADVRDVAGDPVPLYGRDGELQSLREMLAEVQRSSQPRVALIIGAPGIGKTRLRLELQRRLMEEDQRWLHVEGRAEPMRQFRAHAVIEDLLRAHADIPEGESGPGARRKIEAMVAAADVHNELRAGTADFLAELLGVTSPESAALRSARADPQVMADRIRIALRELFDGWTRHRPVLMTLEDLQWADSASLAFVDFLLRRLRGRPLAIVTTAREEFLTERADLPASHVIRLGELLERDVASIVRSILGSEDFSVVEQAEGNPFFAEELARSVRDGADSGTLPSTVEGVVQARLDKLPAAEKDVLKRAAIFGRVFHVDAVEALGQRDALAHLTALRNKEMVASQGFARIGARGRWRFRHRLVQEVALGLLTPEQRRLMHERAAQWLAGRPDAQPDELARHYEEAGNDVAARQAWLRAALAADTRGTPEQVLVFGDRALGVARLEDRQAEGSDPAATLKKSETDSDSGTGLAVADEYALRQRRAMALIWMAHPDAQRAELDALLELEARAGGRIPAHVRAETRRLLAVHLGRVGHPEKAWQVAAAAVELARGSGEPAVTALTEAMLATKLTQLGRLDEAGAHAEAAVALAIRSQDQRALGITFGTLGLYYARRGRPWEALQAMRKARRSLQASGDVRRDVHSSMNEASELLTLGDYERTVRITSTAIAAAQDLGLPLAEGYSLHNRGLARMRLGDVDGGRRDEKAAARIGERYGERRLVAVSYGYAALVELEAGERDRAAELARAGVARILGLDRTLELANRAVLAVTLVAAAPAPEALAACEQALGLRAELGHMGAFESELLLAHHDALSALGRDEDARQAWEKALAAFGERLQTIGDFALRRTFIQNVPAHRRLAQPVA